MGWLLDYQADRRDVFVLAVGEVPSFPLVLKLFVFFTKPSELSSGKRSALTKSWAKSKFPTRAESLFDGTFNRLLKSQRMGGHFGNQPSGHLRDRPGLSVFTRMLRFFSSVGAPATLGTGRRAAEINVNPLCGIQAEVTCPCPAKQLIRQRQVPQDSKSDSLVRA